MAHEAGDHMIFVGHVERMARTGRRPLAFGGGRYLIRSAARLRPPHGRRGQREPRPPARPCAWPPARPWSWPRAWTRRSASRCGTHGPTVLHWEPSSRPVSMSLRAGAVLPLLRSATGRVFAAPAAARRGSGTVRGR
ncbi:MAG: hypothetical protein U1F49_12605 [Rubrivivax sp.]